MTPANPNTTRDHLANERTFLSWIRSCIAIMALGFVVARFGLLIRELGPNAPRHTPIGLSTGFGVALVACGAALTILAALPRRGPLHRPGRLPPVPHTHPVALRRARRCGRTPGSLSGPGRVKRERWHALCTRCALRLLRAL